MHATRYLSPLMKLLPVITVLVASAGDSPRAAAQERQGFDKGFDPGMAVIFEAPKTSRRHEASSPDGRFRAETEYKKIRVYSVEGNKLLHEFSTSGNTNSPLFTADGAKLVAAVCRGNLGCISTAYSWDLKTGVRTRWGECSGYVWGICTDMKGERLAVSTYYGPIFSMVLADRQNKWIGGEIVIFDTAKPDASVRIFCELPGIPSLKQFAREAKAKGQDSDEFNDRLNKRLADANRRCLPVSVGLTPDGKKVIGVTSTGVVRVFDAETGKPELVLSGQSRFGSDVFGSGEESEIDVAAAHAWLQKRLRESNSKKPPFLQQRTDLPLFTLPVVSLNLYGASVTDDELGYIAAFPKLKSLTLSGKGITDHGLKHLLPLKELDTLALRGVGITDGGMKEIAKLRNLKKLDLSGAKVNDAGILELATLLKLQELELKWTSIGDGTLKHVSGMKELRELGLRKTKITDDGLRHLSLMPKLREITLQTTPVTGKGLRHLATCKSLRNIHCWGTDVTNEDIRQFKEFLPNCEIDKTLIE